MLEAEILDAKTTSRILDSETLLRRSAEPRKGVGWSHFLCVEPFAGRANEDERFPARSKFWDCAEALHGVAAREAHYGRRVARYWGRAFDGGG
jgi:hypothetical protein